VLYLVRLISLAKNVETRVHKFVIMSSQPVAQKKIRLGGLMTH